ncbi:MAG: hypothetical protein IJR30_05130 [Prevotella sp.]|nr:hypothetical protein [Prevotella sp.]
MVATTAVFAEEYPYLTFEAVDGSKTSVSVNSLTLTVKDGKLTAGDKTFSLSELSKMYFSTTEATGIEKVIDTVDGAVEVLAIDANSEQQKKFYFTGGTLVAIGSLESGSSLTQTCYTTSSWNKNTWYALYNNGNMTIAFKTPSSGSSTLIVSTSGSTALKSGVSVSSGTEYFDSMANIGGTVSGGTSVSLSTYSSGSQGGGPGGGRW